jgi:phytoene synthase
MCALYAFLRRTDDLSDGSGTVEAKAAALADWRRQLHGTLRGEYQDELAPAFHHAVQRYSIPRCHLEAVLDGVEMDLAPVRFATFADLYPYCYRVASAVGLCCIRIWGGWSGRAEEYAERAGIAFQLTNILRDVAEDAGRDRVYLPQDELRRFGCREAQLRGGPCDDAFRALMRYQVQRAREFYQRAWPLAELLPPPGRAVFQVMMQTYEGLLDAIEGRGFDVFGGRISLSRWYKLGLTLKAVPVRFGWGCARAVPQP